MSGIKFQMGHKRHFANEFHLMASENDFSFDSYCNFWVNSKILKREKVSPSSSWTGKNTSEILYFRQNNQAMLSCHYLFVYWKKKKTKITTLKTKDIQIENLVLQFIICRVLRPSGTWPFGCMAISSLRTWEAKSTSPVSTKSTTSRQPFSSA